VKTLLERFTAFVSATTQQITDLKNQIANGQTPDFSALDQSVADLDSQVKGFTIPSTDAPPATTSAPQTTAAPADAQGQPASA